MTYTLYLQFSWTLQKASLNKSFIHSLDTPLNGSQQLPAPYKRLIDGFSKTNYDRMTAQATISLTINDCLTVTIDGSKCTSDVESS